jgi:hypothetical protein
MGKWGRKPQAVVPEDRDPTRRRSCRPDCKPDCWHVHGAVRVVAALLQLELLGNCRGLIRSYGE